MLPFGLPKGVFLPIPFAPVRENFSLPRTLDPPNDVAVQTG